VVVGSRNPAKSADDPGPWSIKTWEVVSHEQAVRQAGVVVLAIPHDKYGEFITANSNVLFAGSEKIVVDVSNPVTPGFSSCARAIFAKARGSQDDLECGTESSALRTQRALDSIADGKDRTAAHGGACHVVKAFNSVSAYELDNQAARSPPPVVTVTGDSDSAKSAVLNLARRMGYTGLDFGGLEASVVQERTVHRFFDGWVSATIVATIVAVAMTFYYSNTYWAGHKETTRFWMSWLTNPAGDIATTILCLCFLPGSMAGFWQLARGTGRRPFPAWFASWMNIRKQLGLLAFVFASWHAIGGMLQGEPRESEGMKPMYRDYTYIAFGALSFVVFGILAASTGTVSAAGLMSWMEFKFVFGVLGFLTQALLLVHLAYLVPGWIEYLSGDMPEMGAPTNKVVLLYWSVAILSFTMLLKIVLSVPPVSTLLARVRRK
jgi:metalloreductase STEAP4